MSETKKVRKLFWAWNFDQEEHWLNTMARQGWALSRVKFGVYYFEKTQPDDYIIRMDMYASGRDYMEFMEDLGAEYIGRLAQCVYFRRKAELGSFDIFSDLSSRIRHMTAIAWVFRCLLIANICIGIGNSLTPVKVGWINLLCACVLAYGLGRFREQIDAMEREQNCRE